MKEIRGKKILDAIFYIAIVIEVLIVILEKSQYIIQYESYWFRLTFVLFAIKAVFNKYTLKQWIGLFVTGLIAVVSYRVTGRNDMVRIVVLVAACKGMESARLLKTIFWMTLIGCMIIVTLALTGIVGVVAVTDEYRVGIIETRYCFGMGHPNSCHGMALVLTALGLYLYREKLKVVHYIFLFIGNIILYLYTDSRTAVLITGFVVIAFGILSLWKACCESKVYYWCCLAAVVGCVLISVILCETWEYSAIVQRIDEMISLRVKTINVTPNAMPEYWYLFGGAENTAYFDMGIMRMFYWYGWIPGIIYIMINVQLIIEAYRRKDAGLAMLIVCTMFYTVIEAHFISQYLLRNYIYILYGLKVMKTEKAGQRKEEFYCWDYLRLRRGLKCEQ